METTSSYKNIGLLMFVFACALILVTSVGADGQSRGKGNGKHTVNIGTDRQDREKIKSKNEKDDRDERADRGDSNDDQGDRVNGRDRRGNQSTRFAYQRGYKEGLKDGKRAAKNNGSGYNRTGFPSNGNRNGWGNTREWQRAYEDGYHRGFRDGNNQRRGTLDRRADVRRILGINLPR